MTLPNAPCFKTNSLNFISLQLKTLVTNSGLSYDF